VLSCSFTVIKKVEKGYLVYSLTGYIPAIKAAKRSCWIAALINLSKSFCARSNQLEAVGIGISGDLKRATSSAANLSFFRINLK